VIGRHDNQSVLSARHIQGSGDSQVELNGLLKG
jgi:hypothetical protein